jgi:hypothetical protein
MDECSALGLGEGEGGWQKKRYNQDQDTQFHA